MTGPTPRAAGPARRASALASRITYRDVEVTAAATLADGPVVLVANHFGGLADAVLLLDVCQRFPRIVARDVIWRVPLAGRAMRAVGAIPVHRPADTPQGTTDNDTMFSACYQALAEGSLLLIFPEGVTQDEPHLAPVKTGAARIALGAHAAGVADVRIQAAGIHYEDKAGFRSRVLVAFGDTISVEHFATGLPGGVTADANDRRAVRALTDQVSAGMRSVAPDYADWDQAHDLQLSAQVALRAADDRPGPVDDIPLALTEVIASAVSDVGDPAVTRVRAASARYRESLRRLRLDDAILGPGQQRRGLPGSRVLVDVLLVLLLMPYAIAGALLAALPYVLTQATRLIPAAPAVRATILPAVALITFVAEWAALGVSVAIRSGWEAGAVMALLAPAFVGATIVVTERLVLTWRALRRWWTRGSRSPRVQRARELRQDLLAAVADALAQVRR